jgi:hypothetical protein
MSKGRPFRFGVITESTPSREQWITLVRKASDFPLDRLAELEYAKRNIHHRVVQKK